MDDRSIEAWESGRPILDRLPYRGYGDNPTAQALVAWADEFLSERKVQLEEFHRELDPDTCSEASLDYLGFLAGFSGEYWDYQWASEVKRTFIRESYSFLWRGRGTLAVLERVLDIHSIDHKLWQQPNEITLPFTLSGTFGGAGMKLYLRLPLKYPRRRTDWNEAERTVRNWSPACVEGRVNYEYFYLGFSQVGEPLYRGVTTYLLSKGRTVSYGAAFTESLEAGSPDRIIYDVVPGNNQGTLTLSGTGVINYVPTAIWDSRTSDTITYRVWDRGATSPVQRTYTVLLDPPLKLLHPFNVTAPLVNRGLTLTFSSTTVTSGELRVSSGTSGSFNSNLIDANVEVRYDVWIEPADGGQFYDIVTRLSGSTYYVFRVTPTAARAFYFNGVSFSLVGEATYAALAAGFRPVVVQLNGAAYSISVAGVVRLTGTGLLNTTSTFLNIGLSATTAANARLDNLQVRTL